MRNEDGNVTKDFFESGSGILDRSSLAVVIINCIVLTAFFAYSYGGFSHGRANVVPASEIAFTGSGLR